MKTLFAILLAVICLSSVYTADKTYCEVNNQYMNTKLFTSVQEKQYHYLDKYFSGYNLQYQFSFVDLEADHPALNNYKVLQGISEEFDKLQHDDFKIFIAQDDMIKGSGETAFVALAESLEGRYVAKFGIGDKETTPYYVKTIQLPEDKAVTCFDITMITESVAIVDCVKDYSGPVAQPFRNMFYIVSEYGDHAEEYQEIADNWNYVNPFGRKNRLYDTSHDGLQQKYIIQGIPFDLDEGDVTDSYLNIFRYVTNDIEEYHNGHLQINAPITAQTLGITGQFLLADFDVLGDFIYILDHKQGVYFFQYKNNKLVNLKPHLNDASNFANRWGISVNYDGSIVQMLIAESSQIVEYHMYHVEDGPLYTDTYRIDNQLIGTVELQSNADYITLRQGRLLSIYERGQTNMDLLKGVIENVQSYTLFYSNTLMTYNSDEVSNYIIQRPTLRISPHTEEKEFNVVITATSKNFSSTESCSIQLINHIIAEPGSKAFYDANYPKEIDWTDSQSGYTTIPLEKHYVGPNLTYDVKIIPDEEIPEVQSENKFLGKEVTSDEDLNILLYNEPRIVNFDFGFTEDSQSTWQWTLIVPFLNGSEQFYTIHQNTENNVVIYQCNPSYLSWSVVSCNQHVSEISFNAPVKAYSYGTWGNQLETFAAVDSFIPSVVNFYHLIAETDVEPGDFYTSVDFNDIEEWGFGNKVIDMVLNNNTLYAIIEGKSSRFISISSNVVDLQHRERITEADVFSWNKDIQHNWSPEQLTVSSSHKNVLFIKSRTIVYIVSVENHTPYFIDAVLLFKEIGTYTYAGPHSLVIAEADTKIYDYSLVNLNWVSNDSEFTYQTYEYQFIDPFTITSNHYSGLIYVLAHTVNKKDLQLLVYRSGVENVRTLYKVIELESEITIDQQQLVTISVGGIDEDYVFIQYNGKKKYVRSPGEPNIILIPFIQAKNEYVDFVPISMKVHGWDGSSTSAERDVTVVNTQTQIHLDLMKINEQFKDGLFANDKPHAEFELDTKDWYEGSVLGFDIKCEPNPEACGKEITLKSMLHDKVDYNPKDYPDVTDLLNVYEHVLELTRDPSDNNNYVVYKLSDDLDPTKKVVFGKIDSKNDTYECTFITPSYDDMGEFHYLITMCYDYKLQTWATYRLFGDLNSNQDNTNDDEKEEFRYLPGIKDIKRKQYQYFHDKFFINYESDDAYAGIYVFDLENSETITINQNSVLANIKIRVVNSSSFNGEAPNLRITSFYVDYEELDHLLARKDQVYVKLVITDSPQGESYPPYLRFISLKIADKYAPDYNDSDKLDVRKFIQDSQLFVNQYTHLLKIKIMDIHEEHDSLDKLDIVKYHGFLLTDNTAMYKVELVFTRSSSDSEKPLLFSPVRTKITEIFNNYGTNVAYPQIELWQHCIALAYYNPFSKNVTLAIYEYVQLYQGKYGRFYRVDRNSTELKTSLKTASGLPLYTLKAGVKLNSVFGSIGLAFPPVSYILYESNNGAGLLSEDMSYTDNLLAMEYTGNKMTLITDGDFKQQKVSFMAQSDFINKNTVQFSAKVDPNSFVPENDKKSGGVSAWIIVLCVLLGLALLGGVGFFIWKKKFQGNTGSASVPLMKPTGDGTSDMGYSMQEAVKA